MSTAYGTEVEKANLLAGLLDGAGFKAEPMATYQAYADKGLALKAVDQLFVSCMVNGELYLFSTSSTHRPQTVNFDQTPLFSLQTGKPVAIAVPQDYQIKSDIAVRFKDGKVTTSTKESVGKELMPYFTTGNSENEQTAPLKEENNDLTAGCRIWLLPSALWLPEQPAERKPADPTPCQRSLYIHDRMS